MAQKRNWMILAAAVVAIGLGTTAQAAVYYWDINGSTANTGTSATGSWTGNGVFWNPNVAGNGTAVNGTTAATSANDLVFDTYAAGTPGSGYTDGGTVTLSNNRAASSIAFQGNGAMTVTARTLTVGGTGGRQGIYVLSGSANNTVSSEVALANSACTFSNAGSGLLTISGAISSSQNQNLTVNGSGNTTIGSVIGIGTGTLTKSGGGILTLSGASSNTFTGLTTVSEGELDLAKTGAANAVAGNLTISGGTVKYTGAGTNQIADARTVTINGAGAVLDLGAGHTDTVATVTLDGGGQIIGTSSTLTAATYALSGGTVAGNLGTGTINSSGAVVLNGTAGALTVNVTAGTLTLGSANRLADGATVEVSGGTLAMDFNDTVGAVTLSSGAISGAGTLTGSSYALTDTGTIGVNLGSGPAGLTKTGAGAATLSGNNAYTGATTVTEGTLLVNGNQSLATGAITVADGASLGGIGVIGGAVKVNAGGTIRPGNGAGTLNVGTVATPKSVTMDADSIYQWQFDGAAGDTVAIHGDLTLTSGWKLALVDAGGTPTQNVKYDLFTYTGSLTGSVAAAIDYGSTGWGAASVGQEAGKVYLMFSTRTDVLLVAGSPTYDEATQTGFKAGLVEAAVTSGWGVNNSGTAVGNSIKYVGGIDKGLRAVRWDASGAAATELGTLGTDIDGYTAAVALAVNDAGTAVGRLWKNGNFRDVRAVRWDASGTAATELGNLGLSSTGTTIAEAYAVNAGGTAVGSAQRYDSGDDMGKRAVRWDASGAATELPNLGLTSSSSKAYAFAINDANTAVGFSYKPGGLSHSGTRAVRWDALGAVTELGNLGLRIDGVTDARAVAVNSLGTAVGWATKYVDGSAMGDRAVRWDASGIAAIELGNLGTDGGNSTNAYAYAVNDAGTAVGYAQKYVGGNLVGTRAVRWDGTGTAATELGNLGLDINNSTEARAYAVNGAGSAVGYSQKYDGSGVYQGDRAVIWLPDASAIDLNNLGVVPVPTGGTWILTTARAMSADGWVAASGTFDPDGGGPLAGYVRHWVTQVGLGGAWTSPTGGTWGRGPNWSTGTPAMQVGDATFNLNATYTVALDRDELTKNIAINAGTVTINSNGHTLTAESGLTIAGGATLKADGTIIGHIVNAGTLAPGAGVGTLTIGTETVPGSVIMAADSLYEWELGESSADKVVVTGNLTLDDGWKVTLVDAGGAPKFTDQFDLFTYGDYTGMPSFDWHNIDAGATGWDVSRASIGTDGGTVYITGIVGVPGDTNDDGVVDAADFITLKRNFGRSTPLDIPAGDFDGNGTVEWDDLQTLVNHFGQAPLGASTNAPEPASAILLVFGSTALLRRRRRGLPPCP
jgi:fibronectin-binding autotransporter adhesin